MLTLIPRIEGAPEGPTLFFIQGWPDDASLWDDVVGGLRDRYRCVRTNLPNYPGAVQRRWAFDHDEIVAALAACIRELRPAGPVTLIAHDWGGFWAYRLHVRHPELVGRLVALDVGPDVKPNPREVAFILIYQTWLSLAFVVGGALGDAMTRFTARRLGAPRQGDMIGAALNYPYFYYWKEVLTGRELDLSHYAPEVPCMLVYGTRKPTRFHTQRWLDFLRSRPNNQVVELDQQGHWVMRDPQLKEILKRFLDRTNS